jgi:hypothetical protein
VCGWIIKAADYSERCPASSAFVTTNSICQGLQASILWPIVFGSGQSIFFAHRSFKWSNLASNNAGVSVIVVGITNEKTKQRKLFETDSQGNSSVRFVDQINAYLLNAKNVFVEGAREALSFDAEITDGSGALEDGNLVLDYAARSQLIGAADGTFARLVRPYFGSGEFIKGTLRWCLWIEDDELALAITNAEIRRRVDAVREFRAHAGTRARTAVGRPHKFAWINKRGGRQILIPTVFSETRDYITAVYMDEDCIINNAASIVQQPGLHVFSIISSNLHATWVKAISGKLEDRLRYTSATCYNTFPIPPLTDKNKVDLSRCAEHILLVRQSHFPATIADLYEPGNMPADLRDAHERNDEVLERIYIGRRFRNDTERLEKLFELYTKLTANRDATTKRRVEVKE